MTDRIEIKDESKILLAVSEVYYKDMLNLIIQSPTQEKAEQLKSQIISDYDIVNRLNYDIEICELALKEKPDDITLKIILHQLQITKYGDETNYPESII